MQEALGQLREELSLEESADKIKSLWLKKNFEGADKNLEGSRRLAQSMDKARAQGEVFDLNEAVAGDYEAVTKAGAEDFAAVYENYLEKYCKFYSDAAKK